MPVPRRLAAAAGLLTLAAAGTSVGPGALAQPPERPVRTAPALPAVADDDRPLTARGGDVARRSAALTAALRRALTGAGFDALVDFGPVEGRCPEGGGCPDGAPRVAHLPTVDAAVVELDRRGRVTAVANAVLDRDHPDALAVDVGADLAARSVRWYRWDEERWDGSTPWDAPHPADALVAVPPAGARDDVMSPYPGSLVALVAAVHTLRLADAGRLDLDVPFAYRQPGGTSCLGTRFEASAPTRVLLDRALAAGDQGATCMLLAQLHALDEVGPMNAWLQDVGLTTVRVEGVDAAGGSWRPGQVTMTALDAARLLLLVRGARGALWDDASGRPVDADAVLSAGSRALLLRLLGQQGFNEALSTANWCGRADVAAGIPHAVPGRWVDADHGTVTVGGVPYGQDVRPCNAAAEVTFAHRTSLTYTFGADAGIVDALPGARERHYVVAVIGTLGTRYADPRLATASALPCDVDTCFPGALARLGAAVDAAVGAPARARRGPSVRPPAAERRTPATGAPQRSTRQWRAK